ncbi:efflux RND transporter permease subunit, partial [Rhizobium leguminosarum]|uniref:efflux RND transporter permease subunit n=1 Tax=Rhizobium leguminosarum TaxID=384 RepID=UPI003F9ADAE2
KDRLARIAGVGQVQVFGAGDYSMRVWIDPQKAAEHNLAAIDISSAISSHNIQAAAGIIGASPSQPGVDLQLIHGRVHIVRDLDRVRTGR